MSIENIQKMVGDLANTIASQKAATDKVLLHFAENGDVPAALKAIKQLEEQFAKLHADVGKQVEKIRRTSWDTSSNYRGCFASEDQARAFGALAFSRAGPLDYAQRAQEILKRDYPDILAKAMDSSADGGLIPTEFSSRIISLMEQYGVADAECFPATMTGDTQVMLREKGGTTVFVVGENTAVTESKPSIDNVILNAKEWGALTYVPKTLAEDAALASVGELIANDYARAFAEAKDASVFTGDGSSTYRGVVGVRQRLSTLNGVDDGGGLVLAAGNAFSEVTAENLGACEGALPQYADPNAKWFCHRRFFFNVMVKLANAAGGISAGEFQGKKQMLYDGYPVVITQKMPSAQANSLIPALFGDLRKAVTIGRRRNMRIELSDQHRFAERQITYLGTERVAINVHDVGDATTAGPVVGLILAAS